MPDLRRIFEWPWCLYHVLTWAGLVSSWGLVYGPAPLWRVLALVLVLGLAWEVYERYLEQKHGVAPEHDINRWIVDPACDVLGGAIGWAAVELVMC